MKLVYILIFLLLLIIVTLIYLLPINSDNDLEKMIETNKQTIQLPSPNKDGQVSIEKALSERRSKRQFLDEALSISEISQILWSVYGISEKEGDYKTTPSAGAIYPLENYLVVNKESEDLAIGVYRYNPYNHELIKISDELIANDLSQAAYGQDFIAQAPLVLIITGDIEKTARRYGDRAFRYVYLEAGHAAQNLYLQAVSLELNTVVVGAFNDGQIKDLINLLENKEAIYLMPIGRDY